MGRIRSAGLVKRGDVWHIDKTIGGKRLCESTGENELSKAELYLAMRIERARRASIYGERPKRLFREAGERYLRENQHKRRLYIDELHLKQLDPFIGALDLRMVHMGTLQDFIEARRAQGRQTKTINLALGTVRHLLNLAASEWLDEFGLTWLDRPPKITLLKVTDARRPYPLSWEEQTRLFKKLPDHLARMALFKVNTGCREREVCSLQWDWEVRVPELETSVFIIPDTLVKNGECTI
jgi:integrase